MQDRFHPHGDELFAEGALPGRTAPEWRVNPSLKAFSSMAVFSSCVALPRRRARSELSAGEPSLTVLGRWCVPTRTGYQSELGRAFRLSTDRVRVIVPDTGGGFGGKHTGEVAIEAARLAQAAGKPVSLKWTREEEFTWAYFRPAAVIDAEATLDEKGALT
jgi:Molybdopterin-binding domain of aldehyde dehydrogenase